MKGNRAKLAAPPTEDIAVALPLIRINQVETMVVATNPNEPCPMVLSKHTQQTISTGNPPHSSKKLLETSSNIEL